MALQSSGAISLADIAGEFGGSVPLSLADYYGADSSGDGVIPTSGPISFADFYGTSAEPAVQNWAADYRGAVDEDFTSTGITWFTRAAAFGSQYGEPAYGGYMTLAGTGTYPCFYGGSSTSADAMISDFESFWYFGLATQYVTSNANAGWTKLAMTADGRPNEYLVYPSNVSLAAYPTQVGDFINGVDTISINASRADWYTV